MGTNELVVIRGSNTANCGHLGDRGESINGGLLHLEEKEGHTTMMTINVTTDSRDNIPAATRA